MDVIKQGSTEDDESPVPLALPTFEFTLLFGGLMLALFLYGSQALLPSRHELEVAETLAGRGGTRPAFRSDDYVEWEVSPCYGQCPTYHVRLDRQGGVEYQGMAFNCKNGFYRRQIDARQAEAVLAAADIALRGALPEGEAIDASTVMITSRVAGQTRHLELTLGSVVAQTQLPRFLRDGAKTVLDPGWLPVWTSYSDAHCLGPGGERIPYEPQQQSSRR